MGAGGLGCPLSTVHLHADSVPERNRLLRVVERRWRAEARLVLQEFVANAVEHCKDHRVDVVFYRGGLVARDYGGRMHDSVCRKMDGEGGRGLTLIRAFGGGLSRWERGLRLDYRFPSGSRRQIADVR
jgi:anti-sigma regulatory factor (Ser/Thr protein kinase)